MMDRIACTVEEDDPLYHAMIEAQRSAPEETTPDAIMAAVHEVTRDHPGPRHRLLDQIGLDRACAPRANAPARRSSR